MENSSHKNDSSSSRPDPNAQQSKYSGALGLYETWFRRFSELGTLIALIPVYVIGVGCLGLALTPGMILIRWAQPFLQTQSVFVQGLSMGLLIAMTFLLFGFSLIFIMPTLNFVLRAYPVTWRGPYYSLHTIRWGVHNALTYLVRFTFLEFITPTPFNLLFYRWMGMKIGRGVQINSTKISDPCLIELGDKVTIGGSVTIVAHYGQAGFLVIAPVKIAAGATIGLRATIMGDVEIGEKAKVLPNSVVLPKTRIPAGETWGGVPARKIDLFADERSLAKVTPLRKK